MGVCGCVQFMNHLLHVICKHHCFEIFFYLYSGLECLCSVLKCMVEWSREYYTDPATTGLNAVYRPSSEDAPEEMTTNDSRDALRTARAGSTVVRVTDSGQHQTTNVISLGLNFLTLGCLHFLEMSGSEFPIS